MYKSFLVSSLFKKGLSNNIFNNLKNFEEYKLGDLCNITTGKLDANAMVENGKYRFYTCAKEYSFIDEYSFDTEALLISARSFLINTLLASVAKEQIDALFVVRSMSITSNQS